MLLFATLLYFNFAIPVFNFVISEMPICNRPHRIWNLSFLYNSDCVYIYIFHACLFAKTAEGLITIGKLASQNSNFFGTISKVMIHMWIDASFVRKYSFTAFVRTCKRFGFFVILAIDGMVIHHFYAIKFFIATVIRIFHN